MKTAKLFFPSLLVTGSLLVQTSLLAQKAEPVKPNPPPPPGPPPVSIVTPPPAQPQTFVYDQKPLASQPVLIRPEQANAIIEKFRAAYQKLGSPRMVIYVNRALVDQNTGLQVVARTERTDVNRETTTTEFEGNAAPKGTNAVNVPGKGKTSRTATKSQFENRYRNNERKEPTLADRQTMRDIERLFGRPLRMGGVALADQRLATELMANRPLKSITTEGEQARKDREALSKIADVAVEILVSSKNVQVAEVSGDNTYTIPDIQTTAIRLSDARILGQASSSDIIGREHQVSYYARNFDVRTIAETTALALMEDMLTGIDTGAKAEAK